MNVSRRTEPATHMRQTTVYRARQKLRLLFHDGATPEKPRLGTDQAASDMSSGSCGRSLRAPTLPNLPGCRRRPISGRRGAGEKDSRKNFHGDSPSFLRTIQGSPFLCVRNGRGRLQRRGQDARAKKSYQMVEIRFLSDHQIIPHLHQNSKPRRADDPITRVFWTPPR